MKIEKDLYMVAKRENDKTVYLTTDNTFTEDICVAAKAVNKVTAECLMDVYKETKWRNKEISTEEYKDCNFGMNIMPLKITYEW